jgi:hypothetical protein
MVKTVLGKDGITRYELEPPSTVNMQYLIAQAFLPIQEFCEDALALNLSNTVIDMEEEIEGIRKLQHKIIDATSPVLLIGSISATAHRMSGIANYCVESGTGTDLMTSARNLYLVLVIGFVDICCTMDGGSTIIDQMCDPEPQLNCISGCITQYPHLLDWVEMSIKDWKKGMWFASHLSDDPKVRRSMVSEVWYMTSPSRECTLQWPEIYLKEGHGVKRKPINDVFDEVMHAMGDSFKNEDIE